VIDQRGVENRVDIIDKSRSFIVDRIRSQQIHGQIRLMLSYLFPSHPT
jgi:hypothetical protein